MLSYLSKLSGIGGTLKSTPDDFVVEEIAEDGTVLSIESPPSKPDSTGKFVHFILQKRNWSTNSAISEIANRLHLSHKQFSFAGMKDKVAYTSQLVSCQGDKKEALLSLKIKDISIPCAWLAKDKVRMGQLLGNRFTIRIDGGKPPPESDKQISAIFKELNGNFPNYFGEQRFGSVRKNTHKIGKLLLQNKVEDACKSYLCDTLGEENAESVAARKQLESTMDFNGAIKYFPNHLRLERTMLDHLAKNKTDFIGAFQKLPRNVLLLFIHAYQSDLFNTLLSQRILEGEPELEKGEYFCQETLGFPDIDKTGSEGWIVAKLIGFQSPVNEREKALLEKEGIDKESFRMKNFPVLSSAGGYRPVLSPLRDFSFNSDTFRFSLMAGSYATMALREFIDNKS